MSSYRNWSGIARGGDGVSDRQWRDVLGVLKTMADAIDLDYLRHGAEDLRVSDLLKRALAQSRP
jgi:hypothetical protein